MSREVLIQLLRAATKDERFAAELRGALTYQQFKETARSHGFDLGDLGVSEASRMIAIVAGRVTDDLTEEELDLVSGGFGQETLQELLDLDRAPLSLLCWEHA